MRSSKSNALGNSFVAERPKAVEYLSKGREQKETVRDFVFQARNILTA
jgi:hypothetical protein